MHGGRVEDNKLLQDQPQKQPKNMDINFDEVTAAWGEDNHIFEIGEDNLLMEEILELKATIGEQGSRMEPEA